MHLGVLKNFRIRVCLVVFFLTFFNCVFRGFVFLFHAVQNGLLA